MALLEVKDLQVYYGVIQALKGITFEVNGRGENAVFTIREIEDPLKIYCITELGFDGRNIWT